MPHSNRPTPHRLTGHEPLAPEPAGGGAPKPRPQLHEFWQWAFSDLLSNTLRGVFAEWLVATATGVGGELREEWGPYDVRVGDIRVEVKSAAYVQSWAQRRPSPIRFSIAPAPSLLALGPIEATYEQLADVVHGAGGAGSRSSSPASSSR